MKLRAMWLTCSWAVLILMSLIRGNSMFHLPLGRALYVCFEMTTLVVLLNMYSKLFSNVYKWFLNCFSMFKLSLTLKSFDNCILNCLLMSRNIFLTFFKLEIVWQMYSKMSRNVFLTVFNLEIFWQLYYWAKCGEQ